MNFSRPELTLLKQSQSVEFKQHQFSKPLFVVSAVMLLLAVAAKIIGDRSPNNVAAGLLVVSNFFMMFEYVRFRNRALTLIRKLQSGGDSDRTSIPRPLL